VIAPIVLLLGCGSDRPAAPTAPLPSSVTLTGRVVDEANSVPLPDAIITVQGGNNGGRRTTAGPQGDFQLQNLTPGPISLFVLRSGYNAAVHDTTLMRDGSVTILMGRFLTEFALSGRVTDSATGAPLPDATITILDGSVAGRSATTDAGGTYRIPDAPRGGFTIRARRAGYDSEFRPVRLTADTTLDIQMRREHQLLSGTWTGTADFSTGRHLTFAEVTLTHAGSELANAAEEFAASFFRFTGTVREPDRLATGSAIEGTLRWTTLTGNPRTPTTCVGTGTFSGMVSWTSLRIRAPRVVYDCADEPTSDITISLIRQQ
jgi:hypothetical protein